MNEHPHDPDRRREPAVRRKHPIDPAEALRRHDARQEPAAGLVYLRALSAEEHSWMSSMATKIATRYSVDPDDLLQELFVGLVECDAIDRGRPGLRGWLRTRARWTALEMVRRDQVRRRRQSPLDAELCDPPTPEPLVVADPEVTTAALRGMGLNRGESEILLLLLWGLDVSQEEFAGWAERSYAKVRQDRTRAIKKINKLLDLDADETAAVVARRRCGSTRATAEEIGRSELETERLLRSAQTKIDRMLGHIRPPVNRRDEADPDAL